jgi:hypothetical protein
VSEREFRAGPAPRARAPSCPLRDGRPGGGIGWVMVADGKYYATADGGCNGTEENIARWKGWMKLGYTSNKDAQAALAK